MRASSPRYAPQGQVAMATRMGLVPGCTPMTPSPMNASGRMYPAFIIKNKVIKTTPLTSVLPGITRDSIMTLARELGYEVVEQLFTRDELYVADEAFFSGTAAEITPIREVDRRVIGAGKAGPITQLLQKEYFRIVKGENPDYESWLHEYSF